MRLYTDCCVPRTTGPHKFGTGSLFLVAETANLGLESFENRLADEWRHLTSLHQHTTRSRHISRLNLGGHLGMHFQTYLQEIPNRQTAIRTARSELPSSKRSHRARIGNIFVITRIFFR